MRKVQEMEKGYSKDSLAYKDDTMTKSVCLTCDAQIGNDKYRDKLFCQACLDYIQRNL